MKNGFVMATTIVKITATRNQLSVVHSLALQLFYLLSEVCMNNTAENDLFGFPKVKWLQYTGKVWQMYKLSMSNFLRI